MSGDDAAWHRTFGARLAAIAALGGAAQLLYVLAVRWGTVYYDGPYYNAEANLLAAGEGLISAEGLLFDGVARQTAVHPPLTLGWLSISSMLGFRTVGAHQVALVVLGIAVVVVVGLLARSLGGPRAGLIAAGIAAVHPGVWSYPATVMSETPAQLLVATSMLLAYRWWRHPTPLLLAATAGAASLACFARSENLLLLAVLIGLLALRRPGLGARERATALAAAALWSGVLVLPWVAWNQVRIGPEVAFASAGDIALTSANCDLVYEGWAIGYWDPRCRPIVGDPTVARTPTDACGSARDGFETGIFEESCHPVVASPHPDGAPLSEGDIMAMYRRQGLAYIEEHPDRALELAAYRVARTMSIGDPVALARFESVPEKREPVVLLASSLLLYATAALSVLGARRLRAAGLPVWPLLVPLVTAVVGGAITHGTTRYRVGLDVGLIVLAALGIEARWPGRTEREAQALAAPSPVGGATTAR